MNISYVEVARFSDLIEKHQAKFPFVDVFSRRGQKLVFSTGAIDVPVQDIKKIVLHDSPDIRCRESREFYVLDEQQFIFPRTFAHKAAQAFRANPAAEFLCVETQERIRITTLFKNPTYADSGFHYRSDAIHFGRIFDQKLVLLIAGQQVNAYCIRKIAE